MVSRAVLVTGGTGGIGRATAVRLATMGAHIALTGRDGERAEDAAREISAVGRRKVDLFVADMSSRSEVRRLVDEILQGLPHIDVLVNCLWLKDVAKSVRAGDPTPAYNGVCGSLHGWQPWPSVLGRDPR
jgi:NAD(P)-dependent dehydrogenase (short-subunit alcohol dehydrogenase family)